jgi:hypothetical protein
MSGARGEDLVLPDVAALTDLKTFVGRARQIDPAGAVRLVAHGPVLAAWAAALHGAGLPTVLAMRVLALTEPSEADVTVAIGALTDRFAHTDRLLAARPSARPSARDDGPVRLALPPSTATNASWAGVVPPRTGWSVEGVLRLVDLRRTARAGMDEVAAGTPPVAGAAAVSRLRAAVWGRPMTGLTATGPSALTGAAGPAAAGAHDELPAGAAFAAETFGFLGSSRSTGGIDADEVFDQESEQDAVSVHRAGRWWRLSTRRGHVLARTAVTLV